MRPLRLPPLRGRQPLRELIETSRDARDRSGALRDSAGQLVAASKALRARLGFPELGARKRLRSRVE